MDDKLISAVHIEKLGHNIQEIRERALLNILSKLDRGFLYDNELARSKQIIIKLLNWFKFPHYEYEENVLILVKRILETDTGSMLIELFGKSVLLQELSDIKDVISADNKNLVQALCDIVNSKNRVVVPALESDIPLSYRSDDSFQLNAVGSTATTIQGFVQKSPSVLPQARYQEPINNKPSIHDPVPYNTFKWQYLISPDRHVLESVEQTLRNPTDPTALLESCDFFTNVLLQDFPAEVFLQRPAIVKLYHDLLWSCPSSRITTAILNCLNKLTKALKKRLYYYSDPSTHNMKDILLDKSEYSTPRSDSTNCSVKATINGTTQFDDDIILRKSQLSLPQYCLNSIQSVCDYLYVPPDAGVNFKRKKCQIGINTSLSLLNNSIDLLAVCLEKDIWNNTSQDEAVTANLNRINGVLETFATVLEHYRLEVMASDWDESTRMSHLHLICNFITFFNNLIPLEVCDSFLPRNLKNVISSSILDPAFSSLFPNVHESLVQIVQQFSVNHKTDSMNMYEKVKRICDSMSSAVKFLQNWKQFSLLKNIQLAKEGLISLEFHRNSKFLSIFIDLCANKLSLNSFEEDVLGDIDDVITCLLAHKTETIRLEMYRFCQKRVITTIGAKLNLSRSSAPGNQILFLLRPKVLLEISLHGSMDTNNEIQNYAEDILVHILKCKILVPDEIWQQVVVAILPNLPILACHISRTALGRTVLSLLDPDRSEALNLPTVEILKNNSILLYSEHSATREEAVSRMCWILSSHAKNQNLLPHINNLQDKALSLVCRPGRVIDYRRYRHSQHFYQPSALYQVMDLLASDNVEPVIRRSAISQVAVMVEDPILHAIFLEKDGTTLVKRIMQSALLENDYSDYLDSVTACISILKNICLYNAMARQNISRDDEFIHYVLRGIFVFCTEERVKQDGSTLLYTLVFANFIRGSPLKNDLSVPSLVANKLKGPFISLEHAEFSENTLPTLKDVVGDKWALSSLQIHWNTEWFGSLKKLLNGENIVYDKTANFDDLLKLSDNELLAAQSTSLEYCIEKHLQNIKDADSHAVVTDCVNKLTSCIQLIQILKQNQTTVDAICSLPWEISFDRYFNAPPSGSEDIAMLTQILNFSTSLLPVFNKYDNKPLWIQQMLKSHKHYLSDILTTENPKDPELKHLLQSLLVLITDCVCAEQNALDLSINENEWRHLAEIMIGNLHFNNAQNFYNLAYLVNLLSTLVHLSSSIGWSNKNKKLLKDLMAGLFELISAFHCGKGPSAANSFMGLSITRYVVLLMNHVLAEMRHTDMKGWESCFLEEDVNGGSALTCLCTLVLSRDVVLRTAVLHLVSGIATSATAAVHLVQDITVNDMDIWQFSLSCILDHDEASAVKESAATILANLISHSTCVTNEPTIIKSLLPAMQRSKEADQSLKTVIHLLEDNNFYRELSVILCNCYSKSLLNYADSLWEPSSEKNGDGSSGLQYLYKNQQFSTKSNSTASSSRSGFDCVITTPGFIKTLSGFLCNLIILLPNDVSSRLHEFCLERLFLRCITIPSIDIETTKDLTLYCDILEMNRIICSLLSQAIYNNSRCFSVIASTKDCLNNVISLTSASLYHTSVPHLLYLRNKLWCAIYNLLAAVVESDEEEKFKDKSQIILSVLNEGQKESFFLSLCESINAVVANDLQVSALVSLTSLLKLEQATQNGIKPSASMQDMLDSTRTPRTSQPEIADETKPVSKLETIQAIYFDSKLKTNHCNDPDTHEMAGAELCSILMRQYEMIVLNGSGSSKRRHMIINTLSSLLANSKKAKSYAGDSGFVENIVRDLRDIYTKLSLESAECMKKVSDKKRVCPILKDLEALLGLLLNFMADCGKVKRALVDLDLAGLLHKLWVWFAASPQLQTIVLKLLCTFTRDCNQACQSLPSTCSIIGSGPRKGPGNVSLIHAVSGLIVKEMELVSKTHSLVVLQLCFHLLQNCISVVECRMILVKNQMFQALTKLHPAITKRQKPWETVELLWLEFLNDFTSYPEGQTSLAKLADAFELVMSLTTSNKVENRQIALDVLRNISFYQPNRPRLLASSEFLNILSAKLSNGTLQEKDTVVLIIWALAANHQKAKLVFKCANLDTKLLEAIKLLRLSNVAIDPESMDRMLYVLNLLKEGENGR